MDMIENNYWQEECDIEDDCFHALIIAIKKIKDATSEEMTWYTEDDNQYEYCVSKAWLIDQLLNDETFEPQFVDFFYVENYIASILA